MNIKEISIEDYEKMSDEEKIAFYLKIKSDNTFEKAIRQRITKNMKNKGYTQPNGYLMFIDELKRTDRKVTNLYYLCVCKNCGNWYILTNRHFDKEDMISCGCYRKQRGAEMCKNIIGPNNSKNLLNQIFGDLEVIEKTNKRINENVIWKCKCINCGYEQEVQATMLIRGVRMFCEKCSQRKSKGEKIIGSLLDINEIPYTKEQFFPDCKSPETNQYLYFDFFINNKYIIEFDGEQHFKPVRFNNISSDKAKILLEKTQQRDQYKNQWCKKNNIPLIRIPYTHLEKICLNDLLLETSKFII